MVRKKIHLTDSMQRSRSRILGVFVPGMHGRKLSFPSTALTVDPRIIVSYTLATGTPLGPGAEGRAMTLTRGRHAPGHVGTESPRPHVRYRGVLPLWGLAAEASTRRRWAATQLPRTLHRKQGVSCFVLAILEGGTRTAMLRPCPWARASSPRPARSYEVQALRWRNPAITRTRLWFSTASHVERWEGH